MAPFMGTAFTFDPDGEFDAEDPDRYPDDWLETATDGTQHLRATVRRNKPIPFRVGTSGGLEPEGLPGWVIPGSRSGPVAADGSRHFRTGHNTRTHSPMTKAACSTKDSRTGTRFAGSKKSSPKANRLPLGTDRGVNVRRHHRANRIQAIGQDQRRPTTDESRAMRSAA